MLTLSTSIKKIHRGISLFATLKIEEHIRYIGSIVCHTAGHCCHCLAFHVNDPITVSRAEKLRHRLYTTP